MLWDQMNASEPPLPLIDYTLLGFNRTQASASGPAQSHATHALDI